MNKLFFIFLIFIQFQHVFASHVINLNPRKARLNEIQGKVNLITKKFSLFSFQNQETKKEEEVRVPKLCINTVTGEYESITLHYHEETSSYSIVAVGAIVEFPASLIRSSICNFYQISKYTESIPFSPIIRGYVKIEDSYIEGGQIITNVPQEKEYIQTSIKNSEIIGKDFWIKSFVEIENSKIKGNPILVGTSPGNNAVVIKDSEIDFKNNPITKGAYGSVKIINSYVSGNIDLSFPKRSTLSRHKRTLFKKTEDHTHAIEIMNVGTKDNPGIVGDIQIGGYVYVTGGSLRGRFYLYSGEMGTAINLSNATINYTDPNNSTGISGNVSISNSSISGSPTINSKLGFNIMDLSNIKHDITKGVMMIDGESGNAYRFTFDGAGTLKSNNLGFQGTQFIGQMDIDATSAHFENSSFNGKYSFKKETPESFNSEVIVRNSHLALASSQQLNFGGEILWDYCRIANTATITFKGPYTECYNSDIDGTLFVEGNFVITDGSSIEGINSFKPKPETLIGEFQITDSTISGDNEIKGQAILNGATVSGKNRVNGSLGVVATELSPPLSAENEVNGNLGVYYKPIVHQLIINGNISFNNSDVFGKVTHTGGTIHLVNSKIGENVTMNALGIPKRLDNVTVPAGLSFSLTDSGPDSYYNCTLIGGTNGGCIPYPAISGDFVQKPFH